MSSPQADAPFDSSHYQPPPSPDHHPKVIIIVIISCGGFLLALVMVAALLCCLKRKRSKRTREEIDILRADEHRKVKEEIVKGPQGTEAIVVTVEDDVHVDGEIIKKNSIQKLGALATEPGQQSSEQHKTPQPPPPTPTPSSYQA